MTYHFRVGHVDEASELVKRFHYSARAPGNIQCVGTWHDTGGLFGDYGPAVAACFFSVPPTRWAEEVWELSRLVRADHIDVSLTGLIASTCAFIRRTGAMDLLVSFADRTHGHHGGIYQAASWFYDGARDPQNDGLIVDGVFVPGRSCNSRWGTRSADGLQKLLEGHTVESHWDEREAPVLAPVAPQRAEKGIPPRAGSTSLPETDTKRAVRGTSMMKRDFRDSVFSVVLALMRADPNIVVLSNDLNAFGLDDIRKEFPARAINVGIAEQNMMSLAGGLASSGKRVFVYGMIAHLMRAWEQIKVDICIPNLPVTILGLGAGLSMGADGPTHHGTEDVALMRVLSNMTIYNPADWVCAEACVKMAYAAGTPHYIRLDKEQMGNIYSEDHPFTEGYCIWGNAIRKIVATGIEVQRARRVPHACVLDVYRLKPAPDISRWLENMPMTEVWDEHHPNGGLLSIVAEQLCAVERNTLPDKFMPAAPREPLPDKPLAWFDDGYGFPFGG